MQLLIRQFTHAQRNWPAARSGMFLSFWRVEPLQCPNLFFDLKQPPHPSDRITQSPRATDNRLAPALTARGRLRFPLLRRLLKRFPRLRVEHFQSGKLSRDPALVMLSGTFQPTLASHFAPIVGSAQSTAHNLRDLRIGLALQSQLRCPLDVDGHLVPSPAVVRLDFAHSSISLSRLGNCAPQLQRW